MGLIAQLDQLRGGERTRGCDLVGLWPMFLERKEVARLGYQQDGKMLGISCSDGQILSFQILGPPKYWNLVVTRTVNGLNID